MANYFELNQIMDNIIFQKMLRNQDLCKLLWYYPEQADDWDFDPYEQPDITDTTRKLFMKYIYPLPKMPEAKTEQQCYVCVTLSGGYAPEKNIAFKNINLLFDIVCHLDMWKIQDGYRPFSIMYLINDMINNVVTDLPILNKPELVGFQARDYSHYFYGMQLKYDLIINTNIPCPVIPRNLDFRPKPPTDTGFITDN